MSAARALQYMREMVSRMKRDVQAGLKQVETIWESTIERHAELALPGHTTSTTARFLGTVPHIVVAASSAFILWAALPVDLLFHWHPILMTLGVVVLMPEAIFCFSRWSSFSPSSPRPDKTRWHWVLQVCALSCILSGLAVISTNKILSGYPHYTTWHGTLGIFTCGLVTMQTSGGILEMYPTILPFKVRLVVLKRLHAFFGTLTYCAALTTLALALYSNWFAGVLQGRLSPHLFLLVPVLLGLSVLLQFFKNYVLAYFGK